MKTPARFPGFRRGLAALLMTAAATILPAQVTFTFTGTVSQAALGYELDQAVSFSLTTTSAFPNTPNSFFGFREGADYGVWMSDVAAEPSLWDSITGTGLGGAYAPASGDSRFDNIVLTSDDPTALTINASSETTENYLGTLAANGMAVDAIGTSGSAQLPITFILPASYQTLESYFAGYAGTYSVVNYEFVINSYGSESAAFQIDSVTISAVPEPSAYALIAGVLGLGLVALRGRRLA
jgi:hypothetical protein